MADDVGNVGDYGEDEVTAWASKLGVTVNKVQRDRHGWDLYFQFPRPGDAGDGDVASRVSEASCKVQVKTIRAGKGKTKVKLDNWERLAKDPMPCFYVVLEVDDSRTTRDVFLVHVGKTLIEQTLKHLHKLSPKQKKRVHKLERWLSWGDPERLAAPYGESLIAAIKQHIGGDQSKYVREKLRIVERAGFEERPIHLSFTVSAKQSDALNEIMADFAIGMVDRLPVTALSVKEVRFGVATPIDAESSGENDIAVSDLPSVASTMLTIASKKEPSQSVSLVCRTFVSDVVAPWLPPEARKIRFASDYCDLILKPGGGALSWKVHVDEARHSLTKLGKAARATLLLAHTQEDVRITMEDTASGRRSIIDQSTPMSKPDAGLLDFGAVVDAAVVVAEDWGEHNVQVTPSELMSQRNRISLFRGLNDGTASASEVEAGVDEPHPEMEGRSAAYVTTLPLGFGDRALWASMAIVGTAKWTPATDGGGTVSIVGGKLRLVEKGVIPRQKWTKKKAERFRKRAADVLDAEGIEHLLFD